MSDISFPVSIPPVPAPLVAADEGVPSLPNAATYTSAARGESDFDYEVTPLTRGMTENVEQFSGGGLPEGFEPEPLIICVNGQPESRIFLTKS